MPPKKSEGAAAPKAKSGAAHASYQVRCFVPSAACRHLCGYFTTLSACVRLMRGLQDMITDAIANVRWRQPSD